MQRICPKLGVQSEGTCIAFEPSRYVDYDRSFRSPTKNLAATAKTDTAGTFLYSRGVLLCNESTFLRTGYVLLHGLLPWKRFNVEAVLQLQQGHFPVLLIVNAH